MADERLDEIPDGDFSGRGVSIGEERAREGYRRRVYFRWQRVFRIHRGIVSVSLSGVTVMLYGVSLGKMLVREKFQHATHCVI